MALPPSRMAGQSERQSLLLALAPPLAEATTLPAILATAGRWPRLFGVDGLALYLALAPALADGGEDEGDARAGANGHTRLATRTRAHADGLTDEELDALDRAVDTLGTPSGEPGPRVDQSGTGLSWLPASGVPGEVVGLLPLRAGGQSFGMLALTWRGEPDRRGDGDLWASAATQLAAALGRARALETAARSARQARLLAEAGRAFARASIDEAVRRVVGLATELLGDGCMIAIRGPDETDARIVSADHRLPEKRPLLTSMIGGLVRPGEGAPGVVLATGETVVRAPGAVRNIAPARRDAVLALGLRQYLCVALRVQDRISGVLVCSVTEPSTTLTAADVTVAEELARLAATAIENARLDEALRRREREAALLAEAGRLFNASLALGEVMPRVVELAVEEIGDVALIYLCDPEASATDDPELLARADLELAAASFANGAIGARWRAHLARAPRRADGVVGAVLRTGESLLLAGMDGDERINRERVAQLGIRSWIGVPLRGQYGTFGLLSISTAEGGTGRRFDERDLRLADAFGHRATVAIENARLYEQAQRRERDAALLAEAGRLFNASLDLTATLTAVVELTGRALGDSSTIFLVEPNEPELRLAAYYHPNPDERERRAALLRADPPRRGEGYVGAVAGGGPPVLIRDLQADPQAIARYMRAFSLRSWICVPLRDTDDVLGVLTLGTSSALRVLGEHDLALVEAIAERAAAAIEHARLHEDRRRGELLQATIAALAREVGGTLEPGDVARRLAEALRHHFAYSSVNVFLIDRGRREAVLRGSVSRLPEARPAGDTRLPFGVGIVGWVAEVGQAVIVPNVGADPRVGEERVGVGAETAGSELAVPIPGDDGPLGVIDLRSERLDAFDSGDLYVVRSVAQQAAVALENALLHERLTESAATFRDLVERSPDPFFVVSLGGRFLVVNEAMCELTGHGADELRERQLVDLVADGDRETVATMLARAAAGGRGDGEQEWTLRRADGALRIVESRARILTDRGQPVGLQIVGRDVTARREQRQALEQRVTELTALHAAGLALASALEPEEVQRALLSALRAAIPCDAVTLYTVGADGAVSVGATLRPVGDAPVPLLRVRGLVDWALTHKQSLLLNDARRDTRKWVPGFVPQTGFNPERLLLAPLLAGGQPRGCITLQRDTGAPFTPNDLRLVESVAAQAAVTLHNARLHAETTAAAGDLRAVLESIEQGVIMSDRAGRVRFANRRLGELLGLEVRQLIGRPQLEVAEGLIARRLRDPEQFLTRLAWLHDHPEEAGTDEVAVARPQARVLARYSGPMWSAGAPRAPGGTTAGRIEGRIEVYTDVTEARRLERAKDEFLATASHELKTPITTLGGYLELLHRQTARPDGPDPERVRRYTDSARGELERLSRLSEDLLEVARIEAGRLSLRPAPLDLAALTRATVERFVRRPGLRERGHRLVCHAPEPLLGHYDALRLGQVLNNLLENALKYSPAGGEVTVEAARDGEEARLSVRDRGIGVAPEERERLFLPFYRADNASAGSPEGLGLGLYISRGIVEGHGGRIWAEGADGGGSVFRLILPLGERSRDALARAAPPPQQRALPDPNAEERRAKSEERRARDG